MWDENKVPGFRVQGSRRKGSRFRVPGSRFRVNPTPRRLLCEKVSDFFKSFVGSGFIPDLFLDIW